MVSPGKRSNSSKNENDGKELKKQKTSSTTSDSSTLSTISSPMSSPTTSPQVSGSSTHASSPPHSSDNTGKVVAALSASGAFVISGLKTASRVVEQGTRFGGVRTLDGLPSVRLEDSFKNHGTMMLRLLRIGTIARGINLEPIFDPKDDCLRAPVSTYGSQSRRVTIFDQAKPEIREKNRPDASFSTVACVTGCRNTPSDTENALEISAALIHRLGPRSVSKIASLLSFDNPVFVLSNNGISFVTSVRGTSEGKYIKNASMTSVKHGPSPRPYDVKIPVFDGRESFQTTKYSELPTLAFDLEPGDYVFLAFTLQGYIDKGKDKMGPPIQKVKLCVQFAVLLARPRDVGSDGQGPISDTFADETPLGVTDVKPMAPLLPDELEEDDVDLAPLVESEIF